MRDACYCASIRFFIGSDNVAQFFPITDTSTNLLAANITKYYQLFDELTEEAHHMTEYKAYRIKYTAPRTNGCQLFTS